MVCIARGELPGNASPLLVALLFHPCWLLGLSVLNCGYEQRRGEEGYDQAFALVCEVFERPCRAGR